MKSTFKTFLMVLCLSGLLILQSGPVFSQKQTDVKKQQFSKKPKHPLLKKKVKVKHWVHLKQDVNKATGLIHLYDPTNPLKNWSVTLGANTFSETAPGQYRLSSSPYNVIPGKKVRVKMTPPGAVKSLRAVATLGSNNLVAFQSPQNNSSYILLGPNDPPPIIFSWTPAGKQALISLYEVDQSGNILDTLRKDVPATGSYTITNPVGSFLDNKRYKFTVQIFDKFTLKGPVTGDSYLDLVVSNSMYIITQ